MGGESRPFAPGLTGLCYWLDGDFTGWGRQAVSPRTCSKPADTTVVAVAFFALAAPRSLDFKQALTRFNAAPHPVPNTPRSGH